MDIPNDDSAPHLSPQKKVVQPLPGQTGRDEPNPAADVIRQKISRLYSQEPGAQEEQKERTEAGAAGKHRSKHQEFMYALGTSGKSLAEIQTAWHTYYVNLPDNEKHQVWQEFYREHGKAAPHAQPAGAQRHKPQLPETTLRAATHPAKPSEPRSVADIKKQLIGNVQTRSRGTGKSHFRSLVFGLSMGAVVVVIMLLSFFNERMIAPFVTPSKSVSNTPIIIDPNDTAVGPDPKIVIPKINVEIPIIYNEPSVTEAAVQRALEGGVLHYATTPNPGETGNGVIFGHSSNNILNKGKYKFAFVLLNRLENGDTFMVQKDGKRYVYRVFDKKVVKPTDLSVLNTTAKPSTMTLITCDPPGTAINRLVVVGEQITPDPAANIASTVSPAATVQPGTLPSNAPSLWRRLTNWLTG